MLSRCGTQTHRVRSRPTRTVSRLSTCLGTTLLGCLPAPLLFSPCSQVSVLCPAGLPVVLFRSLSGFGLLEAGAVSAKNEVNILVKNAIDVIFGGITYWAFGYGLTFGETPSIGVCKRSSIWGNFLGEDAGSNAFVGVGHWLVGSQNDFSVKGNLYATFIFHLSFATTATTIVSGAMAERTNLHAYVIFSLLNTVIYCIPSRWVVAPGGFLRELGKLIYS